MKKILVLCMAVVVNPGLVAAQNNDANGWLHENVIVTIEIKQADQGVQKFSLVSAKKKFSFEQTMQWKNSPSAKESSTIILEFHGSLDPRATNSDQYQIDSELTLKIPNFINSGDYNIPFIENRWDLAMEIPTGEKISVIDNTDLIVSLSLNKLDIEK